MDSLKTAIEKKFEFDVAPLERAYHEEEQAPEWYSRKVFAAWGARWQHNQLTQDLLPILLEMTDYLTQIENMNAWKHSEVCEAPTKAEAALERLREWINEE